MSLNESVRFQGFILLRLIFAFLLIKIILAVFAASWLAHLFVPLLLIVFSFGSDGKIQWQKIRLSLRAPRGWADIVCVAFFIFPILMNVLFFGDSAVGTLLIWRDWLLSDTAIFSVLLAPLAEELFFRGWLLQKQLDRELVHNEFALARQLKIIYLNALVFWFMHAPVKLTLWEEALSEGMLPMSPGPFFLGLVVATFALKTKHLRAAILFHAIANSHGPLWWPILKFEWLRHLFYQ